MEEGRRGAAIRNGWRGGVTLLMEQRRCLRQSVFLSCGWGLHAPPFKFSRSAFPIAALALGTFESTVQGR